VEKYDIQDPMALGTGKVIRDFEVDADGNPDKVESKMTTLGLCYVHKGLEKTSRKDNGIVEKGPVVLNVLYAYGC
jgi:hypothetical protein